MKTLSSEFHGKIIAMAVVAMLAAPVSADDLFQSLVTVSNGPEARTMTYSYKDLDSILDTTDPDHIQTDFERYFEGFYIKEQSAVDAGLYIRGLPATVNYAEGSTDLLFRIPKLGIDLTFTGETRNESKDKLLDYLKSNDGDLHTRILKELVATTPVDPVAGNPNSLAAAMLGKSYNGAQERSVFVPGKALLNPFSAKAEIGRYDGGSDDFGTDFHQTVVTVPLEYTHYFDDPRRQLRFSMPLTYIDSNGSQSYQGSLGVAYRYPISDDWSLTPNLDVGAAGSRDMDAGAILYAVSINSNYNLYYDDLKVSIGNTLGVLRSAPVDVGDWNIDYDIASQMTRNGVSVEGALGSPFFGKPASWQLALAHTYFWGDEMYVDSYFDFALTYGTRTTDAGSTGDSFRLGLTATVGNNNYRGYGLNFGYKF